ncbi:copper resistance protein D [Labrys miyagiensis]|uniref:Copper resistance protein D n=1 Tax=Labrys miyagiensis TaxID=346912 RepID=A0ABQ6CG02_9HYPH|nr:copper homeostasis membrane protein CopD [Labrys miyagiensis]GLS18608.1 copper resistance protein D [Labrys miyagiensis]
MTGLDWASAAARLGLYAPLVFLFGAFAFPVIFARGSLGGLVMERFRRPILPAAILAVLSIAASLPLLAATIDGDWSGAVDSSTLTVLLAIPNIGLVWVARIALAGLLLIWLCFRLAGPSGPFAIATLLLASLALMGHAVMQEGLIGWFHMANHMIHVLAASLWLGSLPPLLVTLTALRDRASRAEAMDALKRFSRVGHGAVAVVLVTGIVNVWLILGQWPLDWSSLYQLLLATKIALVGLMAATALVNRYVFTPRIGGNGEAALRNIARGTVVEILLGGSVLALVAVFGLLEPA